MTGQNLGSRHFSARAIYLEKRTMHIFGFFNKLVKNNTGVSAKNFLLVSVTIIGCLLLIVPGVILMIEVINNKTITTDLTGLAAYVGAVASLFATAGLTKAWSAKYEVSNDAQENKEENTEPEP